MFTTRGVGRRIAGRRSPGPLVPEHNRNRIGAAIDAFKATCIEYDFATGIEQVTIRQKNEPLPKPSHVQPGSPQVGESAAVARLASALRDLPADHLSVAWRRNIAYIEAGLSDAEFEAPGRDAAALRSEYIRRNGWIALDSCAIAAGRGANAAVDRIPFTACPYDDPVLASEWRRGYRDTAGIVGWSAAVSPANSPNLRPCDTEEMP